MKMRSPGPQLREMKGYPRTTRRTSPAPPRVGPVADAVQPVRHPGARRLRGVLGQMHRGRGPVVDRSRRRDVDEMLGGTPRAVGHVARIVRREAAGPEGAGTDLVDPVIG